MDRWPSVSIIINTDGRGAILANTLASLKYLSYPNFEVVVVPGPTRDGTHEMLAARQGELKVGYCPDRNISRSRNIAVEIASGELLAFLDDDEIPEPEWLDDLVPALVEDPAVGVASGFLYDHTGKAFQSRYETVTRFGAADARSRATPEFNFPLSFNIPHAMINSPFRRAAIADVGGFDEEYEYYLDETDLILRMVDRGWKVVQLDRGFVHHKFLQNATRNERRVQTSWYTIIKNRAYFIVMNAGPFETMTRVMQEIEIYVSMLRDNVATEIEEGTLSPRDFERFEREADQAVRDGLARGNVGVRRLADPARLAGDPSTFLSFPTLLPVARRRRFVLASPGYPPARPDATARHVHSLARAIAAQGHHVHVLTRGDQDDRIDFEDGVWVHRVVARASAPLPAFAGAVPRAAWNEAMAMLGEAEEIAARWQIDCVYAPCHDPAAALFLRAGRWPVVAGAPAPLALRLGRDPGLRADRGFMHDIAEPLLAAERQALAKSDGIIVSGEAACAALEEAHGLQLDRARIGVLPFGLADDSLRPARPPAPAPEGTVRLLFVGRMETATGADKVLRLAPELLEANPQAALDMVGGRPAFYRAALPPTPLPPRLALHGEVDDERLRGFYRAADIVIAPTGGLVALEAMMFGKPVVAGLGDCVEDGVTGLAAATGDDAALRAAVERLLRDPELRRRLGAAARAAFLARFAAAPMAAAAVAFLLRTAAAAK